LTKGFFGGDEHMRLPGFTTDGFLAEGNCEILAEGMLGRRDFLLVETNSAHGK